MYCPLTATPFQRDRYYTEIVPCKELRPYIRCYWGTEEARIREQKKPVSKLVIPDTCADIIYSIDDTAHTVSGGFCGVNDRSFYAIAGENAGHATATFAIRFYAWSAYAFVEDSLKCTVNGHYEVGERFGWLDKMLRPKLLELKTLREKAAFAEELLLKKLSYRRENKIIDNVIPYMIATRGALEISDLAKEFFVSTRQLERLFHDYIGLTPKKLSNLIRYQLLWRDILCETDFDILSGVHRYGYTDQSHLLREFKRYHSMDIQSAKILALKYVGNIQDTLPQPMVK